MNSCSSSTEGRDEEEDVGVSGGVPGPEVGKSKSWLVLSR